MCQRGARWARLGRVVLCAGVWIAGLAAHAQPAADPSLLWNDATLYRDDFGTPHVVAGTLRGMAFAFGYAQAEDQLETILMAYRIAVGRSAEVGGEPFAENDAFAIKIANSDLSAAALAQADPITRDLCEGFALGVNAWIFAHQDRVPTWAEGVQPKDVLAWWHYLMVTSAPFDLPGIYHPKAPLERANAWALAPKNTVNDKTLLVLNPHQYYDGPYRWYEAHLMAAGLNMAGATLVGLPVLMMGHNENAGWGLTPNLADTSDFFLEHLGGPEKPANDPRVAASVLNDVAPLLAFMASAKPYYVRTATGLEERAVPSLSGTRGPLFEGSNGALYSWRNGAYQQFGGLRQLLLMGQASNIAELKQALSMHQISGYQIVCADKAGDIFYAYTARLGNKNAANSPGDKVPLDWSMPVDSGREMFAWSEILPPGALPYLENPASGFLQACGAPPWLATANSGIAAADWPAWLVPEQPNYRTFRVNQILSGGKYTFEDMQAMLFDTFVPAASDMVPLLLSMADARPELIRAAHPDLVTALNLLKGWNLGSDRESPAMAYYSIWWTLMKKRHAAQFKSEAGLYRELLSNTPAAQVQALDAAVEAARVMRNDFNNLSIPWGNLHRIHRGVRNEGASGTDTGDPIFFLNNQSFVNRQWHANFGYGFAMAVEFGEKTRAASIVPFGASENPESPHFSDQMDLFLARRMKPTRFQQASVIQHASRGYGMRIALGTPGLEGFCAVNFDRPQQAQLEAIAAPPGPLPVGQAAFTPAFRPRFEEGAASQPWELELYVLPETCAPEFLSRLQIHTHTLEQGWRPLLEQRFDSATGAFHARGSGEAIIAILGPTEVLKQPETPAEDGTAAGLPPAEDDFLRTPPPAPAEAADGAGEVTEGAVGPDVANADTAASDVPGQERPLVTSGNPRDRLFDVEFMDNPGAPDQAKEGEAEANAQEVPQPLPFGEMSGSEKKSRRVKNAEPQETVIRGRSPRKNFK